MESSVLSAEKVRFGEFEKEKKDQTRIRDIKAPPRKRTTSLKQMTGLVLAPAYFAIGDDWKCDASGETIQITLPEKAIQERDEALDAYFSFWE